MKTTNKDYFRLIPFLLLALLTYLPVQADTVLQGHTIVHYNKVASDQLSVDIRPLDAVPIGSANRYGLPNACRLMLNLNEFVFVD